jgi:hypothetical protein
MVRSGVNNLADINAIAAPRKTQASARNRAAIVDDSVGHHALPGTAGLGRKRFSWQPVSYKIAHEPANASLTVPLSLKIVQRICLGHR